MTQLPEHQEKLWVVALSPAIWALHFIAAYATVALWCGKLGDPATPARIAVAIYTVVALAAVLWIGWHGYKRHQLPGKHASVPHDKDTPEDRHRFLGYTTLLLSGLSAFAILSEALVIVLIRSCR